MDQVSVVLFCVVMLRLCCVVVRVELGISSGSVVMCMENSYCMRVDPELNCVDVAIMDVLCGLYLCMLSYVCVVFVFSFKTELRMIILHVGVL